MCGPKFLPRGFAPFSTFGRLLHTKFFETGLLDDASLQEKTALVGLCEVANHVYIS